jgi:hypothetical protein
MQPDVDPFSERSLEKRTELSDDRVEVERLGVIGVAPSKGQQLPRQCCSSLRRCLDLAQITGRRLVDHVSLEQRAVIQDDAEQVVEVVGNTSGQLAKALQALRLFMLGVHFATMTLGFQFDTVGRVAHGRGDDLALGCVESAETDVCRKLRSIAALRPQLLPTAHRSVGGLAQERPPQGDVPCVKSGWHQQLDVSPDQLVGGPSEHPLGVAAGKKDSPRGVDREQRIWPPRQQATK